MIFWSKTRKSREQHDQERDEITRKVVARFSRGNVLMQSGRYMTSEQLLANSLRADKDMRDINRRLCP